MKHFTAYQLTLQALKDLQPILQKIAKSDGDLARQMRRAATSILLNIAEGNHAQGRRRQSSFLVALGSLHETRAGLDIASVLHYAAETDIRAVDSQFDRVAAILYTLSRG